MATKEAGAEAVENPNVPNGTGSSDAPQPSEPQAAEVTGAGQQPSTNVTDHPDVRRMQAAKDAEIARLRRVADEARRAAEQERAERQRHERESQYAALDSLDADDAKAAAKRILQQRDAESEQTRMAAQAQERLRTAAWEALGEANAERAELGLKALEPTDQRLNFAGGTPDEQLASMQASLRKIAIADAKEALAASRKQSEKQVVQALNDAGVTKIGASEPTATTQSRDTQIKELRESWKRIKGTGNERAYKRLLARAQELGVSLSNDLRGA